MNSKKAMKEALKRSKSDPEFASYTKNFLLLLGNPVFLAKWQQLLRKGNLSDDQIKKFVDDHLHLLSKEVDYENN